MSLRDLLRMVTPGRRDSRNLTFDEAYRAFDAILGGTESEITSTAFLVAIRCKGATVEELRGFASAARDRAQLPGADLPGLVCVSPPHDGSTLAPPLEVASGLVAAGAGARVLVLSDRCVPPRRGLTAASVLEALGAAMTWDPHEAESWVREVGFAACSVSGMLPELLGLRRIREGVDMRTVLSTVEKLIAPAGAAAVVAAQSGPVLGMAVEVLRGLGHKRAIAIQGLEGGVTPAVSRRSRGIELAGASLVPLHVEPEDFGLACAEEPELTLFSPGPEGKGAGDNPDAVKAAGEVTALVLGGEAGPARGATLLGAAVILKAAGRCMTLAEGVDAATSALDSGRALEVLGKLKELSK